VLPRLVTDAIDAPLAAPAAVRLKTPGDRPGPRRPDRQNPCPVRPSRDRRKPDQSPENLFAQAVPVRRAAAVPVAFKRRCKRIGKYFSKEISSPVAHSRFQDGEPRRTDVHLPRPPDGEHPGRLSVARLPASTPVPCCEERRVR
jgi:hypothetical protein